MADDIDFCSQMKTRTRKAHDDSDRKINFKLALVLTDTRLYANVLADFLLVFETMEQAILQHSGHKHVSCLMDKDMFRTEAFEKDISFYLGEDWRGNVTHSMAAELYCERIVAITEENPTLLVA